MALPADYTTKTADEKLALLWEAVASDPYPEDALPTEPPSAWDRRKLFTIGHNRVSFEHCTDEMPAERVKLVHRYGTTATVRIDVDDAHGYTGIFATGGPAMLRFSDAVGGGKVPSLAIKFMVEGKPSVNFLALPNARRDDDNRDPLRGGYSNAIPAPDDLAAKAVGLSFERTSHALGGTRLHAVYLPLHHLAQIERSGAAVADPKVPDRLELHGTAAAREAMTTHKDWRRSLATIPTGTVLFDVEVAESMDAGAVRYGTVVLDEPFVASRYGDERLFFQHDVGPTK